MQESLQVHDRKLAQNKHTQHEDTEHTIQHNTHLCCLLPQPLQLHLQLLMLPLGAPG